MGLGQVLTGGFDIANNIFSTLYNMSLNERLMQRQDNAIQRQTEDLKQAGFNPLLAISNGNLSGASSGGYSARSS